MAEMTERERPRVVVLLGPTGVGKSKLAIELAEEFRGEIINADSMQIYKYMHIGTAKPTIDERRRIPHHLLDVVTPDQPFHAALYRALGRRTIGELYQGGKFMWVVGGSRLYIKALTQGLFLAVHDKKASNSLFESFLLYIQRGASDERNFVKKAVNWALRQIGKRNGGLNNLAIQTAREIARLDSRAARWTAADALRELTSDKTQGRLQAKD